MHAWHRWVALGLVVIAGCGGPEGGADAGGGDAGRIDAGGGDDDAGGGDAGNDAGAAELPPLDPALAQDACEAFCGRAEKCGVIASVGGAACISDCVDALEADPGYVANIACVNVAACDEIVGSCLGDIADDPACVALCGPVEDCGYSALINLQSPPHCVPYCSGSLATDSPEVAPVIACIADALESGECDLFGVLECLPEGGIPDCETACGRVTECLDAGGALIDDFPSVEACETYCAGLSPSQRGELMLCMNVSQSCDQEHCDEIPTAPPTECETGCQNILEACEPDQAFAGELCPHLCSGAHLIPADHDLSTFVPCTEELTACQPDLGEDLFGPFTDTYSSALVYCMLAPSEGCQGYCTDIIACDLSEQTQFACELGCAQVEQENPGEVEPVITCLEGIDRTQPMADICDDVATCTGATR